MTEEEMMRRMSEAEVATALEDVADEVEGLAREVEMWSAMADIAEPTARDAITFCSKLARALAALAQVQVLEHRRVTGVGANDGSVVPVEAPQRHLTLDRDQC